MEQKQKKPLEILDDHIQEINRIVNRGNQAEVKVEHGQIHVIEIRRQLKI